MIRKRGGKFEVFVHGADGSKKYVGLYGTKRDATHAEDEARVHERKVKRGEVSANVDINRTLKEASEEWLESLDANGSRSHETYGNAMKYYVWPAIGSLTVSSVTKPQVMAFRDELVRTKAAGTVNGCLAVLSSAFTEFVDRGWVSTNPVRGVKRVKAGEALYNWISSREDITRLLVECPRGVREITAWALGTGLRISELTHLRWADVDIERRLIAIHRGRQGTTKSGKVRHIPLLNTLLPMAREMKLHRDGSDLVFPGEIGKDGKARTRSLPGVRVPFKQAAKRAGLSPALRFHDLRHTFASHWVLDGGDIFRLSKILGHSSVVITQKTYAHLAPEMWNQDYHRVTFTVPASDTEYGRTNRPSVLALVG